MKREPGDINRDFEHVDADSPKLTLTLSLQGSQLFPRLNDFHDPIADGE